MTLARAKLADIAYVANAAAAVYDNPAATKTYIRGITLFNGNTTVEIVKLYNVPDVASVLGAAGVANQFAEITLLPKDTLIIEWPYPVVLTDTHDSLQAVTTTASKVTIQLHGDTE